MIFEDRIQANPRLFRLKDPRTNEIVDFEIQDLLPEEIVQEGTEIDAAYLNELINVQLAPQAIYCKLGSDVTINNIDYQDITNWQLVNSIGDSFSISGGKVKIGSGVNKIKVTAKIRVYHNGLEGLYSFIRKNNTSSAETWVVDDVNGYKTIYNQAILDVQENDTITINAYGDNIVVQVNSTTLIVEKLA